MSDNYFQSKFGLIQPPIDNQEDGDWDYDAYGQQGYSADSNDGSSGIGALDSLNAALNDLVAIGSTKHLSSTTLVNNRVIELADEDTDINYGFTDQFKVIIVGSLLTVTTKKILDANGNDIRYPATKDKDGNIYFRRRYYSDGTVVKDLNRTHTFKHGDVVFIKPQAARYKDIKVSSYEDFAAVVNGPAIADSETTRAIMPKFKREHYNSSGGWGLGSDLIRYTVGQYSKLSESKDPNDYILGEKIRGIPNQIDDVVVTTTKKFWVINPTPTTFQLSEFPPSTADPIDKIANSNVKSGSGSIPVVFYTPGKNLMVSAWGSNIDAAELLADRTQEAKEVIRNAYKIAQEARSFLEQIPTNPDEVRLFISNMINQYGQLAWDTFVRDPVNKWAAMMLNALSRFDGFHPGPGLTGVTLGQLIDVYSGFNMNKLPIYFRKLVIVLRSIQQQIAMTSPTEAAKYDPILLILEALAQTGEGYELWTETLYVYETVTPIAKALADVGGLFFNPASAGMVVDNLINESAKLGTKILNQTLTLVSSIVLSIPIYIPTNLARIIV